MTKFAYALLFTAASIATPALAEPGAQSIAFQRDGIHYVGTVTDQSNGSRLIAGHEVESGRAFKLVVTGGMVEGTYDNQFIRYDAPHAKLAKAAATAGVAVVSSNAGL